MSTPAPLPIEARRAAWDRLWAVLLAPPKPPDPPPTKKATGGVPVAGEGGA